MAADERAAEVDAFEVVFFGLQVGDLADVVTAEGYELAQLNFGILFSRILRALPYRVQQTS